MLLERVSVLVSYRDSHTFGLQGKDSYVSTSRPVLEGFASISQRLAITEIHCRC